MANIKTKNLDKLLQIVMEKRYIDINTLKPLLEVELGLSEKTAAKYINLLIKVGKLVIYGKYILDKEHYEKLIKEGKPLPGTTEFYAKQEIKTTTAKQETKTKNEEMTEEEKALLGD